MFLLLILTIVAVSAVIRLITLPFRLGYRRPPFFGYGNPYGDYGYHYGYRRHHGIGGILLFILALVLLSHLFGFHHHCI